MKTLTTAFLIIFVLGALDPLAAQDLFDNADADGDEELVFTEVTAVLPRVTKRIFEMVDQNADGVLDYDEYELGYAQGLLRRRRLPRSISQTNSEPDHAPGS